MDICNKFKRDENLLERVRRELEVIKCRNGIIKQTEINITITETENDIKNNELVKQNNNINLFNYGNNKILTITDQNNNVYFKAKDICRILEYKNERDVIKKHIHDKYKFTFEKLYENDNDLKNKLSQSTTITKNEELYKNTIFLSHK